MGYEAAFRALTTPGIVRERARNYSINDYLIYSTNYHLISADDNNIEIHISDKSELSRSFLVDSVKFAAASVETVAAIADESPLPAMTSWPLIQGYYSAYFSAHALMRLMGTSCTNIQPEGMRKITSLGHVTGKIPRGKTFKSGYHTIFYNHSQSKLHLKRSEDRSHEFIWKTLKNVLENAINILDNNISILDDDRSKLKIIFNDLLISIASDAHGNGTFMSSTRNFINYQIPSSCWHPFNNSEMDFETLKRNIDPETLTIGLGHSIIIGIPELQLITTANTLNKLIYTIMADLHNLMLEQRNDPTERVIWLKHRLSR